jgi:AIPR protein
VAFQPVDADLLYRLYQETKNVVSVEFNFPNRTSLPEIEGVTEAYLGILPAKEYLRLVVDDAGNIRKSLFYDNVRDFQSYNLVNLDIQTTLRDPAAQGRFAVLNNGVTIVAKSLRPTGNRVLVEDYQIVNGCQTSHVLYDERDTLGDNVYVPIRVISTSDDNITNAIITATNRQTEVKQEDLQALSSFQRKLEAYFESFSDRQRLFYERRSKQYASVAGIEKARIVTMPQEIRAFSSMFLDEPHRASRYYATLLKLVGAGIFAQNHQLEPYYASAFASYKLEYLFRNQSIPTTYKPARYHLLMALRYRIAGADMPGLTANAMSRYTQPILDVLWNDQLLVDSFRECTDIIDAVINGTALNRDMVKTQDFTNAVRAAALSYPDPAEAKYAIGRTDSPDVQ